MGVFYTGVYYRGGVYFSGSLSKGVYYRVRFSQGMILWDVSIIEVVNYLDINMFINEFFFKCIFYKLTYFIFNASYVMNLTLLTIAVSN